MNTFSDEDVRQLASAVSKSLAEVRANRPSWNTRINVTVSILAIASIFITVGMYWSRITAQERRQDLLEIRMDKEEIELRALDLRVVTQAGDARVNNAVINGKLDAIQRDIDVLKGRIK